MKTVSVIIPTRNEERFIEDLLNDILKQDYPTKLMEVIFVDGLSSDNTKSILSKYSNLYSYFKVYDNFSKVVPHALNIAIKESKNEIIIRMDAHSRYPSNYISQLVLNLNSLKADNVGGVWITLPSNDSLQALAISEATSCVFGIGNANYRLVNEEIRRVDTVPFGCYKRDIFEKIGLFDEELIRNQDDEFNARLIKSGGSIFLIPSIKIQYFARESIKKVAVMFYQYGLFKPLVNKKVGKPSTVRQFFPVGFVLFIILFLSSFFISKTFLALCSSIVIIYFVINLFFTIKLVIKTGKPKLLIILPFVFLIIHLSYGCGYINGFIKFFILGKRVVNPSSISISR